MSTIVRWFNKCFGLSMEETLSRTARVALVEDHEDSRVLLAEALRMCGFQVAECESGEAALQELGRGACDVLVTDFTLSDMTGADLVREVRSRPGYEHMPSVAVTGRATLADEERALFDAVVVKPFDPTKLMRTISEVLGQN